MPFLNYNICMYNNNNNIEDHIIIYNNNTEVPIIMSSNMKIMYNIQTVYIQ